MVSTMLAGILTTGASAGAVTDAQTAGTAPRITTPSNWQITAGSRNIFVVATTGSPTPTLSMSGTLPTGLSFRLNVYGTAVIFGTPPSSVAGQAYTVSITAANGVGPNATQQLRLIAGTTNTTTSLTASPNPVVAGRPVTYTTRVSPLPNGGSVTIRVDGNGMPGCKSVPLNTATGTATCTSTYYLPAGSHSMYAEYSGYGLFLPGAGPTVSTLTVNRAPPAYWLATTNGRVFGLGDAPSLGNANTAAARGLAATADGRGYYVVGAGGGVFAFGTARFFGSVPGLGKRVNNIVAIVPTPDGAGYYVVGSDGGVFTFGDARFFGSVPGLGIRTQHVVAMVASPTGLGYMLVGRDGGVFTFGDVKFYGSIPGLGIRTTSIRGAVLASSEAGGAGFALGYALVGADGGAFKFGTGVKFYGSLPGIGVKVNNIVGIALTRDNGGYFMAGSDGKVYGFGDAKVQPEPTGLRANLPVTAIGGVPAGVPVGQAQRIFSAMQRYLPNGLLELQSVITNYGSPAGFPFPAESSVGFKCPNCGAQRGSAVTVLGSREAAIGWAVYYIKSSQDKGISSSYYVPQYVSGNAVLGPAPENIVNAFGRALGQPVLAIKDV